MKNIARNLAKPQFSWVFVLFMVVLGDFADQHFSWTELPDLLIFTGLCVVVGVVVHVLEHMLNAWGNSK